MLIHSFLHDVLQAAQARPLAAVGFTVAAIPSLVILFLAVRTIYRIWFHPLSKFPGPKLLAASSVPANWHSSVTGTFYWRLQDLHKKYGPIVRIGPDRLALDGSIGWPQVFGRRVKEAEFSKFPDFIFKGDGFSIIGAPTESHRRQRRQLAHAFSEAAVVEQEPIIGQYFDLLVSQLSKRAEKGERVNIVNWLNYTTFDIIGDLTFADSFQALEQGESAWIAHFFDGIKQNAWRRFVAQYALLRPFTTMIMGRSSTEHEEKSMAKTQARMAQGEKRKDLMTYMLRDNRDGHPGLSELEIIVNSSILVGAGSETIATCLSGLFFYLPQNGIQYKRLVDEIRGAFASEDEIHIKSTAKLEYLTACIEEALRIYPPAAEAPPRVCPGAEIDGKYVPAGTLLSVYPWSTFHNPENFADADLYRPERWLAPSHPNYEPRYADDNKATCKPFSYGSRDCIGKNLAFAEMRNIVCRILYRFDVELCPGQSDWHKSQTVYLIWEKGPLWVYLRPRAPSKTE